MNLSDIEDEIIPKDTAIGNLTESEKEKFMKLTLMSCQVCKGSNSTTPVYCGQQGSVLLQICWKRGGTIVIFANECLIDVTGSVVDLERNYSSVYFCDSSVDWLTVIALQLLVGLGRWRCAVRPHPYRLSYWPTSRFGTMLALPSRGQGVSYVPSDSTMALKLGYLSRHELKYRFV